MRVTVTWHRNALFDLAALYLGTKGETQRKSRDMVQEIDELLRIDPNRQGNAGRRRPVSRTRT